MRLNPECVRTVLIYCEANLNNHNIIRFGIGLGDFSQFTDDELQYTSKKMIEGKLLEGRSIGNVQTEINGITWEGHKLLDNIRDDLVWKTVIQKTQKLKSVSIPVLSRISQQIVLDIINSKE